MKRSKFKIISVDDLKKVVIDLMKVYDEIQLVYLYGSYAKGIQTEFSDIDIGVVRDETFEEPPLYFAELSSAIEKEFDYKINVDLKILNNSTPRFLFKVIQNSTTLYVKDYKFMYEFELKAISFYQEIKPMLDVYDKITIMEALGDGN
ncbi:MAG: nucleotidyltransferase domain-containing protein [Promethearchaeota archaeon]|nr:MAG: nucleotidyltransferase domain-containing protein [Candidatus Lokiarchaeota archaeon]